MFNICIYVQYTHILFLYTYRPFFSKVDPKIPPVLLLRSCRGGGCKVLRGTAGCVAWVLPIKNPR